MTTPLYVVTLFPYDDGSEARFQFDTLAEAEVFAGEVNDLPQAILQYISGTGKPTRIVPWVSSTYASPNEAMKELRRWLPGSCPNDGECGHMEDAHDEETGECNEDGCECKPADE